MKKTYMQRLLEYVVHGSKNPLNGFNAMPDQGL